MIRQVTGQGDTLRVRSLSPSRLRVQPSDSAKRVAQDELDLPVETSQVVVRPALERLQDVWVDPQQERFPLRHGYDTAISDRYW